MRRKRFWILVIILASLAALGVYQYSHRNQSRTMWIQCSSTSPKCFVAVRDEWTTNEYIVFKFFVREGPPTILYEVEGIDSKGNRVPLRNTEEWETRFNKELLPVIEALRDLYTDPTKPSKVT
jgi:hypothetical protein